MFKRKENLPVSFVIVMGVLLVALLLLGWLLLEQDARLQQERNRERIAGAAGRLATQVEQRLAGLRDQITQMAVSYSEGTDPAESALALQQESLTGIFIQDREMVVVPETTLHYVPAPYQAVNPVHPWTEATRLEFEAGDLPAALQRLQSMAHDETAWIRAGTLARQARVLNRLGRVEEALASYAELTTLQGVYVEAIPAPWLARLASCSIHESRGDLDALRQTLSLLLEDLRRGGYHVSKATYLFYVESVEPMRERVLPGIERLPMTWPASEAIDDLASVYQEWRNGPGAAEGMRIHGPGGDGLLLLWRNLRDGLFGGMLPLDSLVDQDMQELTNDYAGRGIGWRVIDASGHELMQAQAQRGELSESVVLNLVGGTVLVEAFATSSLSIEPGDRVRRQLLLLGLLLVLSIMVAGTYFMARALRREAEVANLQSEFISAVSHEFRTPLTSIRQVTEMLDSGRVRDPRRQLEYYRILDREAQRLQRMVEDLLDFGRLEADAKPYRPELIELAPFLRDLTAEFAAERQLAPASLRAQLEEGVFVQMDRESLGRALWNLLDNAVKYADGTPEISLTLSREDGQARLEVADRGVGINESDRQHIFEKFVRGSAAEITRAKGTGLGLAMVRKIVEDQGGAISVTGQPGKGTRFIIDLAAEEIA